MSIEVVRVKKEHWAIASKPLQILNLFNHWLGSGKRENLTLCIVNAFDGAEEVYTNIQQSKIIGLTVIFVDEYMAVLIKLRMKGIKTLYIDSDIGFWRRLLILLVRAKQTIVYEEGFGTYDLFRFGPKKIFKSFFGAFFKTTHLMVYQPTKLHHSTARKGMKFPQPLQSFIETNWDLVSKMMKKSDYDTRSGGVKGEVSVYFTRRRLDMLSLERLASKDQETLLVRPHPGLIDPLPSSYVLSDQFFSGEIEMLYLLCDLKVRKVNVYHHGTSMQRYIQHPSLRYIRLNLMGENDQ